MSSWRGMTGNDKPFHEMFLAEYELTSQPQSVPRWSILIVPPEQYSVSSLCCFGRDHVRALAYLWGVNQSGSTRTLAGRILGRRDLRTTLARESEQTLLRKSRAHLRSSPIRRLPLVAESQQLARPLIEWQRAERARARRESAKTHHERLVAKAARSGLRVPNEYLERYVIDAGGSGFSQMWLFVTASSVVGQPAAQLRTLRCSPAQNSFPGAPARQLRFGLL